MDRLPVSANVPAEIAERISDVDAPEFSAQDLKDAREELAEKLLAGDKVSGADLEALIDQEISDNYDGFLRDLYEHFAGIASCGNSAGKCLDGDRLMTRLVNKYLDAHPEIVDERAAEIAAENLELAS